MGGGGWGGNITCVNRLRVSTYVFIYLAIVLGLRGKLRVKNTPQSHVLHLIVPDRGVSTTHNAPTTEAPATHRFRSQQMTEEDICLSGSPNP